MQRSGTPSDLPVDEVKVDRKKDLAKLQADKKLALTQDFKALYRLAKRYETGDLVMQDSQRALELYRNAVNSTRGQELQKIFKQGLATLDPVLNKDRKRYALTCYKVAHLSLKQSSHNLEEVNGLLHYALKIGDETDSFFIADVQTLLGHIAVRKGEDQNAIEFWKHAAEHKHEGQYHIPSNFRMGFTYRFVVVPRDNELSHKYFARIASIYPDARILLLCEAFDSAETVEDKKQALGEMERTITHYRIENVELVSTELGRRYETLGIREQAFHHYKVPAESGVLQAQMYCALYCNEKNDLEGYVFWLQKAVLQNHLEAHLLLAEHYYKTENFSAAIHYFELVDKNVLSSDQLYQLSSCYIKLIEGMRDTEERNTVIKKCIKILKRFAKDGCLPITSEFAIAKIFDKQRKFYEIQGIPSLAMDFAIKAINWYRRPADTGIAYAQFRMARLTTQYVGLTNPYLNKDELERFCKASITHGYREAHFWLGKLCQIQKKYKEAKSNFELAAQDNLDEKGGRLRGNKEAQFELGHLYREGLGVKKDEEKAAYWLRKSSEQTNLKAYEDLVWLGLGTTNPIVLFHVCVADLLWFPTNQEQKQNFSQESLNLLFTSTQTVLERIKRNKPKAEQIHELYLQEPPELRRRIDKNLDASAIVCLNHTIQQRQKKLFKALTKSNKFPGRLFEIINDYTGEPTLLDEMKTITSDQALTYFNTLATKLIEDEPLKKYSCKGIEEESMLTILHIRQRLLDTADEMRLSKLVKTLQKEILILEKKAKKGKLYKFLKDILVSSIPEFLLISIQNAKDEKPDTSLSIGPLETKVKVPERKIAWG